jgi:hypothetical protein
VQEVLKAHNVIALWTEEYLTITEPNGTVVNFGSGDLAVICQGDGIKYAFMIDYKFGRVKVKPAPVNKQGHSYAVALLQMEPSLDHVIVKFLQPRIYYKTDVTIYRGEVAEYYDKIVTVIDEASMPDPPRTPNKACAYCAKSGACGALANVTALASRGEGLPTPPTFESTELTRGDEVAKAWWCMKRVDDMREALKDKVHEMHAAGEDLSFQHGDSYISFQVATFQARRELGNAVEIQQALDGHLSVPQILSCCDVKLTKLEAIYCSLAVEKYTKEYAEAKELLKTWKGLRKTAKKDNNGPALAQADLNLEVVETRIRFYKDNRVTKKSAKEQLIQILESEDLAPRGEVPVKRINMHVTDIATNTIDID